MRQFLFTLLLLWSTFPLSAQPKQEVRAAWVTSLYGLDWPQTRAVNAQTIRKQKEELIAILDKLKAAHFNTVLFQARTRGMLSIRHPSSRSMSSLQELPEKIPATTRSPLLSKNATKEEWNVMPGW